MYEKKVIELSKNYRELEECLEEWAIKSIFLVCDHAVSFLSINDYFSQLEKRIGIRVVRFSDFTANPLYEDVVRGIEIFNRENCDLLIAVGGGSAIDVAKCIKLYSNMDSAVNYLQQKIVPNDIQLWALPTTAGTGSEATRYAVIYYKGEKQSVSDYSCIPQITFMDFSVLETLPTYQRKATMMDAMCHAIESFWSVNSTEESKMYSAEALEVIIANKEAYLQNAEQGNKNMMQAAHLAGKAINITETTAGHAMCYKLTSLYGIAHGHAAALCVAKLWTYMLDNTGQCVEPRGVDYLKAIFINIAQAMGCETPKKAAVVFQQLVDGLFPEPLNVGEEIRYDILCSAVNLTRLRNNPVSLDRQVIDRLYHQILG